MGRVPVWFAKLGQVCDAECWDGLESCPGQLAGAEKLCCILTFAVVPALVRRGMSMGFMPVTDLDRTLAAPMEGYHA